MLRQDFLTALRRLRANAQKIRAKSANRGHSSKPTFSSFSVCNKVLRVHPRKDQAGAAQAGQFEGVHPRLLHSKFKEIWSKPGGVDTPLVFFFKNDQKTPKNWSKVLKLYC